MLTDFVILSSHLTFYSVPCIQFLCKSIQFNLTIGLSKRRFQDTRLQSLAHSLPSLNFTWYFQHSYGLFGDHRIKERVQKAIRKHSKMLVNLIFWVLPESHIYKMCTNKSSVTYYSALNLILCGLFY